MNQDEPSFRKAESGFPALKQCRIYSTKDNKSRRDIYSLIPVKYRNSVKFRVWNRSLTEPADSNYLLLYPQVKEFVKKNKVDFIVLEDMAILNLAKLVRRFQPGVPIAYDAYNVNSLLAATELKKGIIDQKEFEVIHKMETGLAAVVDKIFTCSQNDLEQLFQMNKPSLKGAVIPNGVGVPAVAPLRKTDDGSCKQILFCGSLDYFPNQEGLIWFCREVLPLIVKKNPEARLVVVGKGDPGPELSLLLNDESVINHGRVDRVDSYYYQSAMAIVPLLSGSGTRLKLLEAMAHMAAVVSTAIGAEGIDYTAGENILIADRAEEFAEHIISLLNEPERAEQIAGKGFTLVRENYDWNIVGEKLAEYINKSVEHVRN